MTNTTRRSVPVRRAGRFFYFTTQESTVRNTPIPHRGPAAAPLIAVTALALTIGISSHLAGCDNSGDTVRAGTVNYHGQVHQRSGDLLAEVEREYQKLASGIERLETKTQQLQERRDAYEKAKADAPPLPRAKCVAVYEGVGEDKREGGSAFYHLSETTSVCQLLDTGEIFVIVGRIPEGLEFAYDQSRHDTLSRSWFIGAPK